MPQESDKKLKHRPLTPFRFLRGLICLVVFLTSSLMFIVYFGPFVAVTLRIFSIHHSRKATSFVFGLWLALWPYLFEKINGTKMFFYGDDVPAKERVIIIANHRTEVDWMFLWDLAIRKGSLGYIKYVLKSSLMKLPILGWGFHILEFISVDRKWETDEPVIRQKLSSFMDPEDPLWLAIFPEGTDFTEQKCKMSQIYAAEVGLPVFKNVLLPKTRGFCACLESLGASLDAVYDVTIAYKHSCPTFLDIVFGVDPSEVHVHVRRVPFKKIPASNDETAAWLMEAFETKEKLLSHFTSHGQFPDDAVEGELSTLKCCVNIALVVFLTTSFSYLTFSFTWFKVYTGLVCAYLASATYFDIQPLPILGSLIPTSSYKRTK